MDNSEYYTETFQNNENTDSVEAKKSLDNLAQLWIAFATMEGFNLLQWKKAQSIYDDALNDPLVSKSGAIYISYANYRKQRDKKSTLIAPQKVFIRGLTNTSGLSQADIDLLWIEYLQMMGSNESLEQFYRRLSEELGDAIILSRPSPEAIENRKEISTVGNSTTEIQGNPIKRIKIEENQSLQSDANLLNLASESSNISKEQVSISDNLATPLTSIVKVDSGGNTNSSSELSMKVKTSSEYLWSVLRQLDVDFIAQEKSLQEDLITDIDAEAKVVNDIVSLLSVPFDDNVGNFLPLQLVETYRVRPPMLLTPADQEPLLSGINNLSITEIMEIESVLGAPMNSFDKNYQFGIKKEDGMLFIFIHNIFSK
jgi:hypothetical protein